VGRQKTREEKLFGAAVLRRSFSLRADEGGRAFQVVYDGVLRDLGLTDEEVAEYLAAHQEAVDAAIGRGKVPGGG
jgi:hypothetical protein